ncbi:MAG: hypothetical protein IPJ19_04720 [Planctomycetes bacterium]|nr:hypothetical protein [Planctomycetota bacterium]
MKTPWSLLLSVLLSAPLLAQEGPYTPWVGAPGVTESVHEIMQREAQRTALPPADAGLHVRLHGSLRGANATQNSLSPALAQWPPAAATAQAAPSGGQPGPAPAATVGSWFLGAQSSESPYVPPDSQGAVGPTQILFNVNGRIKVFDKSGILGGLNTSGDNFFQSVRGGSPAVDPQVCYDRTSGRFFCSAITTSVPNRVLMAVSSGSTITDQSSFTFFFFQQDQVTPLGNTGEFADYAKIGVDANAYYVGVNMFNSSLTAFTGSTGFVVKKSSMISGGPIQATAFRGMCGPIGPGPSSPIGVENDDPSATEGYFVGVSNSGFGVVTLRRISNPGGNPSISGNLEVTVPMTGNPQDQPALGSSSALDAIDDRLIAAIIHRNRATGTPSLWTSHQLEVDASGVANGSGNRNGTRWYQFQNLSSIPTLTQSGTLFDAASTNPRGFWFAASAMTGQGHMFLASSYAGNADHAGIAVSGRLASDPLGTLQAPSFAVVSTNNYNVQGGTQRWGDMARAEVDPTDDQSVWAFAEYCNADNSWGVAAVKLLAPPPATPSLCTPPSLAAGASNVLVTLDGASSAGSAFYDTEPGYNRIAVSVSGSGVTVNSVSFVSPTQLTLDLSVSGAASAGGRTITVTNPDGQNLVSATTILTILGAGPGIAGCFGDGTLITPCPCANFGLAGHGCENSIGSGGAVLVASGTISPDTVVLGSSGELASALSIFLQGDVNTTTGVLFGDGLRCAAGTLLRLGSHNASAGSVSYPIGGDLSISARSAALGDTLTPGATRVYQTYYRDPSISFCPAPAGNTWNVSNSQVITW